jgi:hypothetical protein
MNGHENKGASESAIARVVRELAKIVGEGRVPAVLLDHWRKENGFLGDTVLFYSTAEILERNEVFEVAMYCPGYLAFANDGGSMVALLEAKEDAQEVFVNWMGNMKPSSMRSTNQKLGEWIQTGCVFEEEVESEFYADEAVSLRLDKMPDDGIKGLMRFNKALNLGLSITALKQMEKELPVVLDKMSYIGALRAVKELNATSFLSIWSEEKSNLQLPLENPFE